jgi:hypothetical protein
MMVLVMYSSTVMNTSDATAVCLIDIDESNFAFLIAILHDVLHD